MKLIITTLTMIFISFGANASTQTFDIIKKIFLPESALRHLKKESILEKAHIKKGVAIY